MSKAAQEAAEIMAGGILLRENYLQKAVSALRAELEKTLAREAEGVAIFDKLLADANASGKVVREEADYFRAAYARKLDDEMKALRLADAMAEALQTILLCTHEHEIEDIARAALRLAGRLP